MAAYAPLSSSVPQSENTSPKTQVEITHNSSIATNIDRLMVLVSPQSQAPPLADPISSVRNSILAESFS
ncbi:hypothetical protein ABKN59_002316 [Abortiporus biennis]